MEVVLYIFLLFFLIIGICDTVHSIHIRLIAPRKYIKKVMICRLDEEDTDTQINYLAQQYKWYGTKCFDKFICLCDLNKIKSVNFEFSEEFTFIDAEDLEKFYDVLGEEYGLKFQQH